MVQTADEAAVLSPEVALRLVKTQWTGGRSRRSSRFVNAYDECCAQENKNCTVCEVAGYCATVKQTYRALLNL